MLLKITHLPIVGAIWVFESVNDQVNGGAKAFSSIGPGSSQITGDSGIALKRQRPFLTNRSSAKTSSQHYTDAPPQEYGSNSPSPQAQWSSSVNGKKEGMVGMQNTDLENQVKELSVKIAELTALIMAQQGTNNME